MTAAFDPAQAHAPTPAAEPQRTPLHALHQRLGGKIVPFAGWALPVSYPEGQVAEHRHARAAAALFDVSHMGQVRLDGPSFEAVAAALETLLPADVLGLPVGKQRYSQFTTADAGVVDDLMIARPPEGALGGVLGPVFLVVNAANADTDLALLQAGLPAGVTATRLHERALLALQGPEAVAALARVAPAAADTLNALRFMEGAVLELAGAACWVVRSGYTGEDGVEISVPADQAVALAEALLADAAVKPAGLGARDTLRLEAGLCLHGHELDTTITPIEAGLAWSVPKVRRAGGARAGGYPGAARVEAQLREGPARRRVGLLAQERVPVRDGAALHDAAGRLVGRVCSGTLSPGVAQPIAMAYVEAASAAEGTALFAQVRGRGVPVTVSPLPFVPHRYRRV